MRQQTILAGMSEKELRVWAAGGGVLRLRTEIVEGYEAWCVYTGEPRPRVKVTSAGAPHVFRTPQKLLVWLEKLGAIAADLTVTRQAVAYHAQTRHRIDLVDAALAARRTSLTKVAKAKGYPYLKLQRTYLNMSRFEDAKAILADLCDQPVDAMWPAWPDTIGLRGDGRVEHTVD